ncbi:MAG: DNA-processing protein DprA [Planctomycetaceae bacterium]
MSDHKLAALQLNLVPGLGPRTTAVLLDQLGSPAAIFDCQPETLLRVPGVGPKLVRSIRAHRDFSTARREFARCQAANVDLVLSSEPGYPTRLSEVVDPPHLLFCRGHIEAADQWSVAVVGARQCTTYGRRQAESLAAGLAEHGWTIVSGLARGIDAAAHRAALAAGGRTLAVLASGVVHIYPPEHRALADAVTAQGGLVSEMSSLQKPAAGLFPQRNRIISGLSLAVIIVEAGERSGSLHTARHALEQGRDVFAVPGRVDSWTSAGCHALIRDGVVLVRGIDDVLESLSPAAILTPSHPSSTARPPGPPTEPAAVDLSPLEHELLSRIPPCPTSIDQIVRVSGWDTAQVLSMLTQLEIRQLIQRLPGSAVRRSSATDL